MIMDHWRGLFDLVELIVGQQVIITVTDDTRVRIQQLINDPIAHKTTETVIRIGLRLKRSPAYQGSSIMRTIGRRAE